MIGGTPYRMIDAILRHRGNAAVFDDLLHLMEGRKAIAFVGAGASAGMYPLWREFLQQLLSYAVKLQKIDPASASHPSSLDGSPQQQLNRIVRRLGRGEYEKFLRQTFGPRQRSDGRRYTDVHALLLRAPFRGYVTTNYDPGLEFARMELRPECSTSGTPTWRNDDVVNEWLTGDIFDRPNAVPILWAHGYWQMPSQIVLNAGEYTTAYNSRIYSDVFRKLWQQERLVFVGFSFSDPRFTFMVSEILRDTEAARGVPRHIAIIGLQPGTTDAGVEDIRADLEEGFHVRPLFYQVHIHPDGSEDHGELLTILGALADPAADLAAPSSGTAVPAMRVQPYFVHEMTNDARFVGRDNEIATLDRWALDPAVRAIGISAVGGTGKTALTGHWLMNTAEWRARQFDAVFGWSFYRDREPQSFLQTLRDWGQRSLHVTSAGSERDPAAAVMRVLKERALVVVMDGLEVQQEGREDLGFGTFLDPVLRYFMNAVCSQQHRSVVVLTSRFAFADIERYMGTSFHQMELHGLAPVHGERLLLDLGVYGAPADRQEVSRSLEGHPLGLRIFADSIPPGQRESPRAFLEEAFSPSEIAEESALAGKIRRLLSFYERRLPPEEVRLLSVVSLFHAPANKETIISLFRGILRDAAFRQPGDDLLSAALERLHLRGILSREPAGRGHGYIAHPILRDYFRAVLVGDEALRAADLLTGTPSGRLGLERKDLELFTVAVEVLIEAREWRAANDIYRSRLQDGDLFRKLQALSVGLRTALAFTRDELRRKECEAFLGKKSLSYLLNEVGLFASLTGEYELAARYYESANAIDRETLDSKNLCAGLRNEAHLLVCLGDLDAALFKAEESRLVEYGMGYRHTMSNTHGVLGWIECLKGETHKAAGHFALATMFRDTDASFGEVSMGGREVRCAELLLRVGLLNEAKAVVAHRLDKKYSPVDPEADMRCFWILGACALAEGDIDKAESLLMKADDAFRAADELFDLARVQVTLGELALVRGEPLVAIDRAVDALALSQPRGIRLVQADALVVRGHARLATGDRRRALDDADEALRIARECNYGWAQRDAFVLRGAYDEAELLSLKFAIQPEDIAREMSIARYMAR